MLSLNNTTLVIVDTVEERRDYIKNLLDKLQTKISFHDVIVFSDKPLPDYKTIYIPTINTLHEYSLVCYDVIPPQVKSDYSMWIQWDGHPLNIDNWTDEFYKYDYIGAPWPWKAGNYRDGGSSGNGGFSFRTKKFTDLMTTLPRWGKMEWAHEDGTVCDIARKKFLSEGCQYAPYEIMGKFSFELPCKYMNLMNVEQSVAMDLSEADFSIEECFGWHNKFLMEKAKSIFERNFN